MAWRGVELRLLVPIAFLVPLGFVVTHIALSGTAEPGPMQLAGVYVAILVVAHVALVVAGHRGDQLLLPAVGAMGAWASSCSIASRRTWRARVAFGLELGMAATQVLWLAVGADGNARDRHRTA